SHMAEI
nr:Chain E, Short peptide SHMAEI [synthetic construct]3E0M_F Chain F, Short peptide SHMAEI [synthetic construct]3E0M_G Chain G, Short peptide SHMAEI [synthetic construct]